MKTGYVEVNALRMYYEIHGDGRPVVLLHGALSAIGTSFGKLIPELAKDHQVIALEMQGHGRTADVDRPFQLDGMADDTVAALRKLGVAKADVFGYSLGAGVALNIAIRHPEFVAKLVLASVTYNLDGFHPGLLEGISNLKPEMMVGSPWQQEYAQIAPHPEAFAALVQKIQGLNASIASWPADAIRSIQSAKPAGVWRFRHHPSRSCRGDVWTSRGWHQRRYARWVATIEPGDSARHVSYDGRGPSRAVVADAHLLPEMTREEITDEESLPCDS